MKLSFGIKLKKNLDRFLLYQNIESIIFFERPVNSVVVHSHNLAIEKKKKYHMTRSIKTRF